MQFLCCKCLKLLSFIKDTPCKEIKIISKKQMLNIDK